MKFSDRTYPDIVRDLLTFMTGGTASEVHTVGNETDPLIYLDNRPVRRISHLAGQVLVGEKLVDYRFTDRDFELVSGPDNPSVLSAIRFKPRAKRPAPGTQLVVNYYPMRLRPTPLTDVNVGSVARTFVETISREMAVQYQQLQKVYESAFVETAQGDSLDKVGALVDTGRIKKGRAVGSVRFSRKSGSPGSIFIPVKTVVSDGAGTRYETSDESTMLPSQSSVEVWVNGQTSATAPVEAGALTVLERAIAGVDRCTNDAPTYRTAEDETDQQYVSRMRRAIHVAGKGTVDALRYGLEGIGCVTVVSISEYGDPSVRAPGIIRIDVALGIDSEANKRLVDRRIEELRPAGIYIERYWAERVSIEFTVPLTLKGSDLPPALIADIESMIGERFIKYVATLGPGETVRKSQLLTLVMQDTRVADATVTMSTDGSIIESDTWVLPQGKAASIDQANPVIFPPVTFEAAAPTGDATITLHAYCTVHLESGTAASLATAIRPALTTFAGTLNPSATVTFDQLAAAIRNDTLFALSRDGAIFTFEDKDGTATDVREGGSFVLPPQFTLTIGVVECTEESE